MSVGTGLPGCTPAMATSPQEELELSSNNNASPKLTTELKTLPELPGPSKQASLNELTASPELTPLPELTGTGFIRVKGLVENTEVYM